jgi:protein involved in polysaccharide export with SLBB domain
MGLNKRSFAVFLACWMIVSPVFAQSTSFNKNKSQQVKHINGTNVPNLDDEEGNKSLLNQNSNSLSNMNQSFNQFEQKIKVHVLGDVVNHGVYNAVVSDRALDILKMAKPKSESLRIFQIRNPAYKTRYYDLYQYYYFGNLKHNPYLRDNDVIFIPNSKGSLRIEGPVKRPGLYELWNEKNLLQVVNLVGGFTRAMAKTKPLRVIRFSEGGQKFILDVEHTKSDLRRFKIQKGDIIIVPDIINMNKEFDYSVESMPGENIVYPTSVANIFVIGAVNEPGSYPYKSHLTIKNYLGFAGASANANLRSVRILRNGKRVRKRLHGKVQSGDVIIVREKGLNKFLGYLSIASTLIGVTLSTIVLKDVISNQ